MSKGLEELKKLGDEYPSEGDTLWSQYSERFSIIEKELKDYEETKKELKQVMNDYQDLGNSCYKKLKAFEILKDHIKISLSFYDGDEKHTRYSAEVSEFDITPEQRSLLKEVLL